MSSVLFICLVLIMALSASLAHALWRLKKLHVDRRVLTPSISKPPHSIRESSVFIVVAEIRRFAALRKRIGYRLAAAVLEQTSKRALGVLAGAELGRIGRTTIELTFRGSNADHARDQLRAAIRAMEERLDIGGLALELSVDVGFADAGNASIHDGLVDQAAVALSRAQAQHEKLVLADSSILADSGSVDVELMAALPQAMAAGEISLHYQPKLNARSNQINSAEALIRWLRPGSGLVPTDRFIMLAEDTGAIGDITEWVIERAIADQKKLAANGHRLTIYVNISGQLLAHASFCRRVLSLIQTADGEIGFEITETAVIDDPEAALEHLKQFKDAGIRIAIDDYGSGLSSLAYLKQLPAHELKIDRMFISGLTDSHRDPLLVRSSIDLAHALEMEVTAEGVDNPLALSLLRVMGCDLLQGYEISPPLPLAELMTFLRDDARHAELARPTMAIPNWNIAES